MGKIEVYRNLRWTSICATSDSDISSDILELMCRQLGKSGGTQLASTVGEGPWATVASCSGEDVKHVHNCNISQGEENCQNLNLECDTVSSGPPFWGLRMIQGNGR
jgi:uncharacterized phage-associated protein